MKPIFIVLSLAAIGLAACSSSSDQTEAMQALHQQETVLQCRLHAIKDSITGQWDEVNQLLTEKLPSDIPAEEKANMLKVRNANLIRMFQSYNDLDQELKSTLDQTEQLDQEMTQQITALKQELQELELRKMAFFEKIYKEKGKEEHARVKLIYETLPDQSCP